MNGSEWEWDSVPYRSRETPFRVFYRCTRATVKLPPSSHVTLTFSPIHFCSSFAPSTLTANRSPESSANIANSCLLPAMTTATPRTEVLLASDAVGLAEIFSQFVL